MIINFANLGGGGGGGYVLPVASQSTLGGVKIGDGVNIDSAGTISVQSSDPTILKSVSALPLTAESGDVCVYNDETYVYNTESSVSCSVYNNRIAQNENVTEHIIQWYGELPSDEPIITVRISTWNQTYYITYDSQNNQFKLWNNISMELGNLVSTLPINGEISGVNWGTFNWRCYNNVINVYGVEFNYVLGIYGDWNEVSGAHWEPIDWAYNIANPRKFLMDYNTMPRATKNRLGVAKAGNGLSANFGGEFNVNIATTGQTGMVKIGSGVNVDSAGTITVTSVNGVGFWKGTQSEYDALSGTTGYDSSTLYIITPSNN